MKPVSLSKLITLYNDPKVGLIGQTQFVKNLEKYNIPYLESDIEILFQDDPIQAGLGNKVEIQSTKDISAGNDCGVK